MELHTWLVYVLAVIGLSLSPGPNGLLALTHGALYGRRMTLYTIIGGCCGFIVVIALSMFGIGAPIQLFAFHAARIRGSLHPGAETRPAAISPVSHSS